MDKPKEHSRIKMIRKSLGYTQEQFAEILDLSLSGYKKLESGDVNLTLDKIYILNKKLGLSADYILFDAKAEFNNVWAEIFKLSEREKWRVFLRLYSYLIVKIENESLIIELLKSVDTVVDNLLSNAIEGEGNHAKDNCSRG